MISHLEDVIQQFVSRLVFWPSPFWSFRQVLNHHQGFGIKKTIQQPINDVTFGDVRCEKVSIIKLNSKQTHRLQRSSNCQCILEGSGVQMTGVSLKPQHIGNALDLHRCLLIVGHSYSVVELIGVNI